MGIVRKASGKSIVWHSDWPGNIQNAGAEPGQIPRIPGIRFGKSYRIDEDGARTRKQHRKRSFHRFDKR